MRTATGGDPFTVNVGQYHLDKNDAPFANRHAASLRAIYDLADPEQSVFMYQTGQERQCAVTPVPGHERGLGFGGLPPASDAARRMAQHPGSQALKKKAPEQGASLWRRGQAPGLPLLRQLA